MAVYILLFDGVSGYELMFPAFILRKKDLVLVGLEADEVTTEEGLKIKPNISLEAMPIADVEAFIIPGGNALKHIDNSKLPKVLEELHEKQILIAAICGAPVLLSQTTILEKKRFTAGGGELPDSWQKHFTTGTYVVEDVVEDGSLITAKGAAVASFATAIGRKLAVFKDKADEENNYRLIKDIR